jgi:hypothetical protein
LIALGGGTQLDVMSPDQQARHWTISLLLFIAVGCGGAPASKGGGAGAGGAGHPGMGTAGASGGAAGSPGAGGASGTAGASAAGRAGAADSVGSGAAGSSGASGHAGSAGLAGAGAGAAGHTPLDGGGVDAVDGGLANDGAPSDGGGLANLFTDPFDSFQTSIWSCEYSCPTVANGTARFTLHAGAAPDTMNSWSKIRYKPRRFTEGRFTVRFALTARPAQTVWWGVALWDDGPAADGSQFNEINFGYTTDESFTNTQLRFESTKRGTGVSLKVDTGVDLYDGQMHTGVLEYDATHVSFFFDGTLLKTITDTSVIPTDPVDFIIGPRLVTGSAALPVDFVEIADSTEIAW